MVWQTIIYYGLRTYIIFEKSSGRLLLLSSKMKNARYWILFLSLLASLMLCCFYLFHINQDSWRFDQLCTSMFRSEMAANTLSMHYTIADPSSYHIDYEVTLPVFKPEEVGNSSARLEDTLQSLSSISSAKLNSQNQYTYGLLTTYLKNRLALSQFAYYEEPLSPSSGMQSALPVLLADYTFRSSVDVEDYLSILSQTGAYFDGLIVYEKQKAASGLYMADYSAKKVSQQCLKIMDEAKLSSNTHFLQITFKERILALQEQNLLTKEQCLSYEKENSRLLTTIMLPAYQKVVAAVMQLKGQGVNECGLSHFPSGKEYYVYILAASTGSYRSIPEIKQMLMNDFTSNYDALVTLVKTYPVLIEDSSSRELPFSFTTPEEMLTHLQSMMLQDYPPFPAGTTYTPACLVKKVSESMQPYSSPAYYLTPPIDNMRDNTIYINERTTTTGLNLYTTLAHEGYPGHLYQTVYSQLYANQQSQNPVRHLLNYGGFVEGWAVYVENQSYAYAAKVMQPKLPSAVYEYESYRLNRCLQLCLYSLLDIAIHYDGADFEQVQKILSYIGISNEETARAIFEYIVEEPTIYPKYYVGFLEMNQLKEKAQTLWGSDFTLMRFHQFILETGPSDFTSLESALLTAEK